jgi:hypothetical protein
MFVADWGNDEIWFFACVTDKKPADLRLVFVKICTLAASFNYVVATSCTLSDLCYVMLFFVNFANAEIEFIFVSLLSNYQIAQFVISDDSNEYSHHYITS